MVNLTSLISKMQKTDIYSSEFNQLCTILYKNIFNEKFDRVVIGKSRYCDLVDVKSRVMEKFIKHLPRIKIGADSLIVGWFKTVAINTVIDLHRRNLQDKSINESTLFKNTDDGYGIEETVAADGDNQNFELLLESVYAILDEETAPLGASMLKEYIHGLFEVTEEPNLDYQRLSEIHNMGLNTVKCRIFRGREYLINKLQKRNLV